MSTKSRQRMRAQRFFEQDGRCAYCGGAMVLLTGPQPMPLPAHCATFEHKVQRVDQGADRASNCLCVCVACNVARPNGMAWQAFHRLRQGLLSVWAACTHLPASLRHAVQSQGRHYIRAHLEPAL